MFGRGREKLEIRGGTKIIQTIDLLKWARILRGILEIFGDLLLLGVQ